MKLRCQKFAALLLLAGLAAVAQIPNADAVVDAEFETWVAAETARWQEAAAGRHDVRIEPGMRADRQAREVEILGVAVGARPPGPDYAGDPVEFVLVQTHGRDYEALVVTPVRGRLLHRALQWIGMQPGEPANAETGRYWPRGERVVITCRWTTEKANGDPVTHEARAEELLVDKRRGETLPPVGFVFVGSYEYEDGDGYRGYAADATGDIVSDFNDSAVVLDVPYLARQSERYGHIVANPEQALPAGTHVRVFLRPELPAGETRTRDFTLRPNLAADIADPGTADLRFTWLDGDGKVLLDNAAFRDLLAAIQQQYAAKRDVWITLELPPELPVAPLSEFCAMLDEMAQRSIIRLNPPADGQFYYQAFLPRPQWRDRQERLSQPLEIHLARNGPGGRLVWIDEQYGEQGRRLTPHEWTFADPDELAAILGARDTWATDALLVYAPAGTTVATLHAVCDPLADRFPVVYVFAE